MPAGSGPPSKRATPARYSVYDATRKQLDAVDCQSIHPALYAAALNVATVLDETTAARDTAALTRELRGLLAEVRELIEPPQEVTDDVDDLEARRAARRAAAGS